MIIENGKLAIHFDDKTGSIVRVEDRSSRIVHSDTTGTPGLGRLFQVMAPTPRWQGRCVQSHASPPPAIRRGDNRIEILYPDLRVNGQTTGIEAAVTVEIGERTDEIVFALQLTNRGRCFQRTRSFTLYSTRRVWLRCSRRSAN